MLNFLKEVNIDDKIINEMYKMHDEAMIYNLKANAENCLGIILFMQKVGIKVINDLLLYKPEWFLKTVNDFSKEIDNSIIKRINDNYLDVEL